MHSLVLYAVSYCVEVFFPNSLYEKMCVKTYKCINVIIDITLKNLQNVKRINRKQWR